jgi:hypothetical protein
LSAISWQGVNLSAISWQGVNLSAISWQEQVSFWWDDDDVCFVLAIALSWIFKVENKAAEYALYIVDEENSKSYI